MSKYYKNIIWLGVTFIGFSFILLVFNCPCQYSDILKNVFIGLISSLLLLILIEIRDLVRDANTFGKLAGKYRRTEIHQVDYDKKVDSKYNSMMEAYNKEGVETKITLQYKGEREYYFEAEYFEGKVLAHFFINQTNPKIGKGHYQYLSKKEKYIKTMPDIGHYEIQVDETNPKKLYLFHHNLIPSGLADGYEVWELK